MCCCFTSNENCHFSSENADLPKRVVDFPLDRDTFRNKIMEFVEDFDEKSYNNNGKPWKSLRIFRLNPFFHFFKKIFIFSFFLIVSFFFHFFHLFHFSIFSFFHFLNFFMFSFFFIVFFIFFQFLIFSSFSFMFVHFLSFSFMFFRFPSLSFIF